MTATSVNPSKVPKRTTNRGYSMPAIGMGTFGSDHVDPSTMAKAVRMAIELGYRHIDCAQVYGNEVEIGEAIHGAIRDGVVTREELWITGKLWNDRHKDGEALVAITESLRDLQLDYLDLYLIHWPYPNHHDPGVNADARHPDSRPYIHEDYMSVWMQLERAYSAGLVRHIGASNMTTKKLSMLLRDCAVKPAAVEMELHPHFQQPALFDLCQANGIIPIAYSPLGSPNRPKRDRAPGDTVDIKDPVLMSIAETRTAHPATICLKWAVQRGQVPIPMSTKERNLLSNLVAVTEDPLTDEEMAKLESIDKGCRLIKGHVFLWHGANDWTDLWDGEA